jgi:hypothetical protein
MEKHGEMNLYTLDEFIDEEFGVAETPTRQLFDAIVAEKAMASKRKNAQPSSRI